MKAPWLGVLVAGGTWAAEPSLQVDLGTGHSLDLILIRSGGFILGSPVDEIGRGEDETTHPVRLTRDYYFARTAVTRGQWERFIAETGYRTEAEVGTSGGFGWDGNALSQRKEFTWRNPGFTQTGEHPVCLVTYPDAEAFCQWSRKNPTAKPPSLPRRSGNMRVAPGLQPHGTAANGMPGTRQMLVTARGPPIPTNLTLGA